MVTGGCGFIGSHLVRRLLASGVERVVVLDSLRYGRPQNLGPEADSDRVTLVPFTLGQDSATRLEAALDGVDFLFHLAAEKHNQSVGAPERVFRANIEGTRVLLDCAARTGVRKVVFSSSLYAHGRMSGPPAAEDEIPLPTTIYGISKLCGERLLAHYEEEAGLRGVSLRFYFVYGPRQHSGTGYKSVIVKNFERIRSGEPPIIFGGGEQALDYTYVDDVVEAMMHCLASPTSGEVFNVASGEATSVARLTRIMLEVAGSEFEPLTAKMNGMPKRAR